MLNMLLAKWNSKNKLGNHESNEDKSDNIAVQTQHQSSTARNKKNSVTEYSNRNTAKLIDKTAQTTTTNSCTNKE